MSWRNLYPDGLEGRTTHRSAPQEDNGRDNSLDNGNFSNQVSRHRVRRGLASSHAALSFQNEANVNMAAVASAANVGAAPADGDDVLMVPLYSGEVIRGGMLAATGTGEVAAVSTGVGASGSGHPCQGEDSNGRGDLNRSRTPIRSGSRSVGGSSASNESSSDGLRHVMAIPEARRDLIYRLLSSERCDCGEVNCPH